MKNRIKFCKFVKVASKVLIGILIALAVLVVAALIFRACTPAENNLAYASEADGIGVWEWNETPTLPSKFGSIMTMTYVCDGIEYTNISWLASGITYGEQIDGLLAYIAGKGWNSEIYRTIVVSYVEPAFLSILQSNATYKGATIPTTYTVTKQATDCSIIGADTVEAGQTYNYQIAPNTGHVYPNTVQVFNAEYTYDNTTGKLTVSNITDNVTIIATAPIRQDIIGYWHWDDTLSEMANIVGEYNVNFSVDNVDYNKISFTTSNGAQIVFYTDVLGNAIEVYNTNLTSKWKEPYQNIKINDLPEDNRFVEYLTLNAEYFGLNVVVGKYTFVQFPLLPIGIGEWDTQQVNFSTTFVNDNGNEFVTNWQAMHWEGYETNGPYYALYYALTADDMPGTKVYEQTVDFGTKWVSPIYQTVDFGNVPQTVAEDYLTWLNANAAKGDITTGEEYKLGFYYGQIAGRRQGLEEAKQIVTPNSASWNAGYDKGMADAADNTLLDGPKAIFGSIVEILNIDLFGIPGFTVGAIVAIVVALGVLLFILKIIRG